MSDHMNISTWNFDDVVVPLTPEYMMKTHTDSANLEGSKFISSQDSDPLQELLSLDDTIFDQFEVDANVDSIAHGKSKLFNESKFFLDETLHDDPSNCSDNAADCLLEDSFIKYNNNVADELNASVNFLKTKLFDMPGEKFVQPPKKKTCLEKSNNATNLKKSNDFYGLPEILKNSIKKYKGIDKLYDWQDECLKMKAIEERKNLIYALPTSGGKTLVAEILMFKEIICNKKNVMFVLPFVALVQEKIQAITPFALEFNFLIEEYAAAKGTYPPKKRRKKNSLYICTIEKAQTIINCLIELNRLEEIGMIVVDELHLLGETGGRGATLECLLTKVLHSNSNIHIIGMSATIGNLEEITSFLKAELYIKNFRPVDIKEYVKCETDIWLVDSRLEEIYTDKKTINYPYSERARQLDPDFLGGLVMDVVPKDSCLIFCASRKNCENVAVLLTQVLFSSLEKHRSEEKLKLLSALQTENNEICPILSRTIKYGVAYHHSGLTGEERKLIEEAFKSGVLCVICCTSTLAAGVNLPARRVILRSPYVGSQFLNLSRYKQMIGRAGRAGLGEIGESILICSKKDMMLVSDLLRSKMDAATSSLHEDIDRGINNLIISSVLLNIANTRKDIHAIVSKSLLKVQENRLGINVKEIADKALASLLKAGVLRVKQKEKSRTYIKLDATVVYPTQIDDIFEEMKVPSKPIEKPTKTIIKLVNDTEIELCPLGKAAMKGSIDLNTAHTLYEDLRKASANLVIIDHLHLLYLITPYDIASQVKPIGTVYHDVMMSLPPHQMQVARYLGLNEAVVERLRAGITPKNVDNRIVARFYVTLMLYELWNRKSIYHVAQKYQVNRGTIQNLLNLAASFATSTVRFCQELDEFWAYSDLLTTFGQKLTYCCASELEPLMDLPYVKIGRAKQLYKAGYKTLQSIAKAKPKDLMNDIDNLSKKVVSQIISAAKLILMEKVENLRDEVEEVLDGLEI
ncbi:helicase POLQ-like [Trichogramma pretiosum]|uniref:helicase POLQ-like n=1 Tax=Trichogramma pretiosum TaxID=7493 RepID=UPI0006C9C75F|nr:helicase POLQ-like [Trichogramma pretiosum]